MMESPETILVHGGERESRILIGGGLEQLPGLVPENRRCILIVDANVERLHGQNLPAWDRLLVDPGETAKTPESAVDLIRRLLEMEADRNCFLIGVGGGVVCDLTGFVASVFMRGVRFGFVATTLLAQVDASVGGKNGVNIDGYKNIMGVFNQPEFVLCASAPLSTLPSCELGNGLAEICKHILIADAAMLPYLEENAEAALAADATVLRRLVSHSVRIKAGVVSRDEREAGERRKLNFGHTVGHAVEKLEHRPHGESVAIGTAVAVRLSATRGYLEEAEVARIEALLTRLQLPIEASTPVPVLLEAMRRDKKRVGDGVYFVFLKRIGEAVIDLLPLAELESILCK